LLGHRNRVAVDDTSGCIESLRKQRALPQEQQIGRRGKLGIRRAINDLDAIRRAAGP
jgi:hypothetical protein